MEGKTFVNPAVAGLLETQFVEARLHVDYEQFLDLERDLLGSIAQPVYAIVDADADIKAGDPEFDLSQVKILSRKDGGLTNLDEVSPFVDFLNLGLGKDGVKAEVQDQ